MRYHHVTSYQVQALLRNWIEVVAGLTPLCDAQWIPNFPGWRWKDRTHICGNTMHRTNGKRAELHAPRALLVIPCVAVSCALIRIA